MTIDKGWYVSECASEIYPYPKQDLNTVYAPYNITQEGRMYYYCELRCNLPVNYELPDNLIPTLATALDEVGDNASEQLADMGDELLQTYYDLVLAEYGLEEGE